MRADYQRGDEAPPTYAILTHFRCPNCDECGKGFEEFSKHVVEKHGFTYGPFEEYDEVWLECLACGAKTDMDELNAVNAECRHCDDDHPGMYVFCPSEPDHCNGCESMPCHERNEEYPPELRCACAHCNVVHT